MDNKFYKESLDFEKIRSINCNKLMSAKNYGDLAKEECLINAYFDGHCNDTQCSYYFRKTHKDHLTKY